MDPELFEQCAADLVRLEGLLIVPIRGGSDAGMDAALSDTEGEAFPLVITTAKDVIGNFTRSLKSYVLHGGKRRKAAIATNQALSATRQRNIRDRAGELGFTLVALVEQAGMADLLYRSPRWCRDLLSLAGDPPALSALPVSSRPLVASAVVARVSEVEWLANGIGDQLLFGQPGSGKTHLLRQFVRNGLGLFVVSEDLGRIAGALRETRVSCLLVDDAHLNPAFLPRLDHLREELGADFRIIATSWLSGSSEVVSALQIGSDNARELPPLTRDEMVGVVAACGIEGPRRLVREIVDQSEGKPGLAATLCHLIMRGDARSVVFGDALVDYVSRSLAAPAGRHALQLLAGLSFGGEAGLGIETAAGILELSLADAQLELATLAAGGVIEETVGFPRNNPALVVRPDALRFALIRDVAFGQPGYPWRLFIEAIDRPDQSLTTLVAAKLRGADIPTEVLQQLASISGDEGLQAFAYLGENQSRWVLETAPDKVLAVSAPALQNAPNLAIPLLLDRAVGDERLPHSTPEHPIRLLSDWVRASPPGSRDVLSRRLVLARETASWLATGGNPAVGGRAFSISLDPSFERNEVDPGAGMTMSFIWGPLDAREIESLGSVWEVVTQAHGEHGVDWPSTIEALQRWAHPRTLSNQAIGDEVTAALAAGAREMIADLIPLAEGHPGVLTRLRALADDVDLKTNVDIPAEFAILFPEEDYAQGSEAMLERQRLAAESLAAELASQSAAEVVRRLVSHENEAAVARIAWPRLTPTVAKHLAAAVRSPIEWMSELLDAGGPPDVIAPLIQRVLRERARGWGAILAKMMSLDPFMLVGSEAALMFLDSDSEYVAAAIEILNASPFGPQMVETLALRGEIPLWTLALLLTRGSQATRTAAAVGEWLADPKGSVRGELIHEWRMALLKAPEEAYWIGEILSADEELALAWLKGRVRDDRFTAWYLSEHEATIKAVQALGRESRSELIATMPVTVMFGELVAGLVSGNAELLKVLLARDDAQSVHLAPLRGHPPQEWPELVRAASGAGYTPAQIGGAAFDGSMSWSGNESEMWRAWEREFSGYLEHDDDTVRAAASAATQYARERREMALAEERDEAVRGISRSLRYRARRG